MILSERVIFLRVNHRHTKRKERASGSGKSPLNTSVNKNAPASKVREKKSKNETLGCPHSKWKRKKERVHLLAVRMTSLRDMNLPGWYLFLH